MEFGVYKGRSFITAFHIGPVLDFITDYLHDGTVIIFDDWGCFENTQTGANKRLLLNGKPRTGILLLTNFISSIGMANSFIVNFEFL